MSERMLLPVLHLFNDGYLAAMPLLLPFASSELGLSLGMVGLLGSMLSFSGIMLALPAGMVAAAIGPNRLLCFAVLSYCVGFLILGFSSGVLLIVVAFVFGSLAFGIFHPVAFSSVAKESDSTDLGKRMGTFAATGDIGRIVFAAAVTFIVGLTSWRSTALVYGVVAGVFFIICMASTTRKVHARSHRSGEGLTLDLSLFKDRHFFWANCASVMDSFANSSLFIFLPFLLTFRGIDATLLGSFTAVFFVGNLLGKVVMGRLVDKIGQIRIFIFSEASIFVALMVLALVPSSALIMGLALVLGFLTKGTVPITSTMIAESVKGKNSFETAYSVNSFSVSIATTAAPLFFGVLADRFGVQMIFFGCAFVALCSTLPALLLKRTIHILGDPMNENLNLRDLLCTELEQNQRLGDFPWEKIDGLWMSELGIDSPVGLSSAVMSSLIPPAPPEELRRVVPEDFIPGTFFLSERLSRPAFISMKDNLPFPEWVDAAVKNEIERLLTAFPETDSMIREKEAEKSISVGDYVFCALFLPTEDGCRLLEVVPNQIYQDVFTKLIASFIYEDTFHYPCVEQDYNEKIERISYSIAERIKDYPLKKLFAFSVSAGCLGVDMKSSASAASPIHRSLSNIIFYDIGELETEQEKLERMFAQLKKMAAKRFEIDCWQDFALDIVFAKSPVILSWFHDDCAETIIDLLFIQSLLAQNSNITVVSIPRSGKHGVRFGNDASSMDILRHLSSPCFSSLRRMWKGDRFQFLEEGPCWGAVYAPHFSEEVVKMLLKSTAIVVKGSRSYELLQGINCNAYFASMVCRDFSESVFDIDAESGHSVFVHQRPLLSSFEGFKDRFKRTRRLDSGKDIMLCPMTAKDYLPATRNNRYDALKSRFSTEAEANRWIVEGARRTGKTIARFILDQNASE